MVLSFMDTSMTALSDESLPVVPPNPSLFDINSFSIQISPSPGVTTAGLSFSIDSLSGYVVPIPSAIWLFGSGLLGLIGIARGKKRWVIS